MNALWYLVTRAIMALAALMCVDVIADTTLAAEPTSILAMTGLLVIAEVLIAANVEEQQLTAADVVEAQQRAQITTLTDEMRAHADES